MASSQTTQQDAEAVSMRGVFTVKAVSDDQIGKSSYAIVVKEDFCFAGHISGGYINAIALNAAEQFISTNFPSNSKTHVISSYIQFFRNMLSGQVNLTCGLVSNTSRQIVIKVELAGSTQPDSIPDIPPVKITSVLAIFTFRTNDPTDGLSQQISSPALANLPDREKDCSQIDVPFMNYLPMTRKFRWWSPRSSPSDGKGVWGHHAGGNIRDVFIRTAESLPLGIHELTWIVDLGLQPPFTLDDDLVLRYEVATLNITIEYKKPIPQQLEWVLVRTHSNVVRQGRYDVDCFIIDPKDNEVLLLARHVVLAKTASRGRGGTRQSPNL
ncbi:thioesterase-like superfamily-domain-containing protein [Mariannaea sp. PMI_226]|nr:thioesterase-like superfamily-domain-containing protein [Mariannaea sp. PMI_226]